MNKRLGLLGVLGIWLTAGFALPFVNILKVFSPEQLMIFRGFLTALMALVGLRGVVGKVDKYTWLITLVAPCATLGLYQGVRHWGTGATMIILTATPIVNVIIGLWLGRKISGAALLGLVLVLGGVIISRHGGQFHIKGLLWSVFATVMSGVLFELFARATASSMQKCFHACMGMGCVGLVFSFHTPWVRPDGHLFLVLIGFAFVGGFLYWIANLVAFENLPVTEASVLVQGETPAVIIGAYFILGEKLSIIQWIGVGISLLGAGYLSQWLAKNSEQA